MDDATNEERRERARAARILDSVEMLMWWSSVRNESLAQTKSHFQSLLHRIPPADQPAPAWREEYHAPPSLRERFKDEVAEFKKGVGGKGKGGKEDVGRKKEGAKNVRRREERRKVVEKEEEEEEESSGERESEESEGLYEGPGASSKKGK